MDEEDTKYRRKGVDGQQGKVVRGRGYAFLHAGR